MFPFLYLLDFILYGLHGPGVGLAVDILDFLVHQTGVYLGGRDVRVAQHLLDGTQVRTVLQQVGGEGVAQGVGRDVLLDARLLLIVLDELPKALAAHPLPVHVHKQSGLVQILHQPGTHVMDIVIQHLDGGGI